MDTRISLMLALWLFGLSPSWADDWIESGTAAWNDLVGSGSSWLYGSDGTKSTYNREAGGSGNLSAAQFPDPGEAMTFGAVALGLGTTGVIYKTAVDLPVVDTLRVGVNRYVAVPAVAAVAVKVLRGGIALAGLSAFAQWAAKNALRWNAAEQVFEEEDQSNSGGPSSTTRVYTDGYCNGAYYPTAEGACGCAPGSSEITVAPGSTMCNGKINGSSTQWMVSSAAANASNCPSGYSYNGSACVTALSWRRITDTEAQTKLSNDTAVVSPSASPNLRDIVREQLQTGTAPKHQTTEVTGPATKTQTKTQNNPDGSTTTKTKLVNISYQGPEVSTTTTTTTQTCINGSCNTTVTEGEEIVQCDKYPDSLGCAKLGDPGTKTNLQEKDKANLFNPVSFGSSSGCPSPLSGSYLGQSFVISYDPVCQFASGIRFVVLAIAWVSAGWILFGTLKGA